MSKKLLAFNGETGELKCEVEDNGRVVGIESNGRTINPPGSNYDVAHFTYAIRCPPCLALGGGGKMITISQDVGIVQNEPEKSVREFASSETMRNRVLRLVSENCSRRKEKL